MSENKNDDFLDPPYFSWKDPFDVMWLVFKWLLVIYLIADFTKYIYKALMS